MKALVVLASLCLTVVQLAPFAIVPIALQIKSSKYEQSLQNPIPDTSVSDPNANIGYYDNLNAGKTPIDGLDPDGVDAPDYSTNTILYFDGYGSIRYNKDYFVCSSLDPNTTKRLLGFEDNATRLEMDYVTHLDAKTDINGYIMQEVAGIDSVTNDNVSILAGDKTWVCITADKPEAITNNVQKVYYLLTPNGDSAFWIKASISYLCDTAKFEALMLNMLASIDVYYNSNIQVELPNSGYYADNKIEDPNRANGQEQFKENDEDNNVHDSGEVTVDTNLSSDKFSMQLQLDGKVLSIYNDQGQLNTLQSLLDNGYSLIYDSPESQIRPLESTEIRLQANSGKTGTDSVKVAVKNMSGDQVLKLTECSITGITITPPNFAGSQLPDDFFVIPGGFATKSLRRGILDAYGTPSSESQGTSESDGSALHTYRWTEGAKNVEIVTAPTAGIKQFKIYISE